MLEALVGIIAGGVLTGGVQQYFRWQDARDKRRAAARSLLRELQWWRHALRRALEARDSSELAHPPITEAVWRDAQLAVARVPFEKWHLIEIAVRTIAFGAIAEDARAERASLVAGLEASLRDALATVEEPHAPELLDAVEQIRKTAVSASWTDDRAPAFVTAIGHVDSGIAVLRELA